MKKAKSLAAFEQGQLKIGQDLVHQELDGEMVILNIQSGQYFGIEEIGSRIWTMLEQGMRPAAMVQGLIAEYAVEETLCREQVAAFLDELLQEGLIELVEPA
ncbi:PqqD family peptide modification chaperone [Desulfogranum mediterraneum]|uniref:PqqD family peptide modification chaperone n=1 Tax=Desulfogranum mediterraneum TaxID=160661 RepID=UPI00041E0ED1|nr:PqqD family peptide modification chaperone [Desulfogranum mediterraneum]